MRRPQTMWQDQAVRTEVQEVEVPAADLERRPLRIPGGVSGPVLLPPPACPHGRRQGRGGLCRRRLVPEYCGLGDWPLRDRPFRFGHVSPSSAALCRRPRPMSPPASEELELSGAGYVSQYFFELDALFSRPRARSRARRQAMPSGPRHARGGYNCIPSPVGRRKRSRSADLSNHFLVIGSPSSVAPF